MHSYIQSCLSVILCVLLEGRGKFTRAVCVSCVGTGRVATKSGWQQLVDIVGWSDETILVIRRFLLCGLCRSSFVRTARK